MSEGSQATRLVLLFRLIASAGFILAGTLHLIRPDLYLRLIPPYLPAPAVLVLLSGLAEIAGGVGLLIPPLRRAAGWGLIALLVAVFPANLHMALLPEKFADLHLPTWAFWARLPLQGLLIIWVWIVSLERLRNR